MIAGGTGGEGITVELGNKKCPISGRDATEGAHVNWHGLRVGLCCGGCAKKVLANPGKVLDAAGIEWREAADLVAKANAAKGATREKLLADLGKRWKIVGDEAPATSTAKEWVVDLGNAKCPIMGGKVSGKAFTVVNGLRIGLCCGMCRAKLLADPAAVLDKAGIEWRKAAVAVARVASARGAARVKLLAELKKHYEVVGE